MRPGIAFLAAAFLATSAAGRERALEPGRHALQRAAYELATGNPAAAAAALAAVDSSRDGGGDGDGEWRALLASQADILRGETASAAARLEALASARDDRVRGLAAAHRLALATAGRAVTSGRDLGAAQSAWDDGRGALAAEDRALGDLAAAVLHHRQGDDRAAEASLARVRKGPAAPVAALLGGERALRRGEARAAGAAFGQAAKTDPDPWGGWLTGWAQVGIARCLAHAGDTTAARAALERGVRPEPLASEARFLDAQWAYATGDREGARAALDGLALSGWEPLLGAEAELLACQVALDGGDHSAAESLAARVEAARGVLAAAGRVDARAIVFDLRSWHESLAQAALGALDDRGVLRDVPRVSRLARRESILRMESDAPRRARDDIVLLQRLLDHGPEPREIGVERGAWRQAARMASARERAAAARDAAASRLEERRALLSRGRSALVETEAAVSELGRAALAARAGLAAHAARVAALERAWIALLGERLSKLESALAALRRADTRLEARYPVGRGVRARESVAEARARAAGLAAFRVQAESLHADLAGRYADRVHGIFTQHELAGTAARLDSLDAWIASLGERAAALRAALDGADAAERLALAAAETTLALAQAEAARADESGAAAERTSVRVVAAESRARSFAYVEAAGWGGATARFHAALAAAPDDPERAERFARARAALGSFVAAHPGSEHVAEALYRLGECALSQAQIEYERDLAHWLEQGESAERAPVPMEGYADALAAYRRLLREHPTSPRAHDAAYQCGFVLAEMGSLEESAAELERFLAAADSLDPRAGRAALRLGDDHLLLGDRRAALVAFRRAARAPEAEPRDLGAFKAGWCAYDLDAHEEARAHLRALLQHAVGDSAAAPRARELAPEALELVALAFAADHDPQAAARALDAWPRPPYDFALLRRIGQLYASRAQYDEAIAMDELILERHPQHPSLPAVGEDLLHWLAVRRGPAAAHARAATLAPLFAADGAWARAARPEAQGDALRPRWQSRLVEEDVAAAQADSLAATLADPARAAARMAARLRAAAVFEHRAAQSDSTRHAAGLARAAALYEQVLDVFPGTEDEPTTWLYLGEARTGLGLHTRAADAYAAAAAHPSADSALAHTASAALLAALASAASRPEGRSQLERYEKTAERFATRWPHDGRAVDAFAHVGELAFGAADWDRADRAYGAVAQRSPEPRRVAAALKMQGDIAWKRERFDAAAASYDEAQARARAAGADSLAGALARLVPAALYRGAETREAAGDRRAAAERFESLSEAHPKFEFADRCLYRAAGLRAALGDTASAVADHRRLLAAHPGSPLVADARLELGRGLESLGEREAAARAYRDFAVRHPDRAQARATRLRAGLLFAGAGQTAAADSEYAAVLRDLEPEPGRASDPALAADLWVRRARLAGAPERAAPHWRRALASGGGLGAAERAEAHFQVAEAERPAYAALRLAQPIAKTLAAKQKSLESLLAGYGESAAADVEPWHAAACLRIGEALVEFGRALHESEPPAGLEGEDLFAYQETLAQQSATLEDRAVAAWSRGLAAARTARHADGWTRATEEKLWPLLATRVPMRPVPLFVVVAPQAMEDGSPAVPAK